MKKDLKKMAAAILAAASICTCLSGCGKKMEDVATSNPVPTPTIAASDSTSGTHEITGDVDTSGGVKMENGRIVLTPIEVKSPNNCAQNGYMEYEYLDGTYRYKEYESAVKAKGLVPYTDADGKGLTIETGHTVYIRNTQNLSNTPSASGGNSDNIESSTGEQATIENEYVENSSGYIDENGNYVKNPSSTSTGNDIDLYSDSKQQKCIVSGEEVYDIDNFTNEIEYPTDFAQLRKEGSCERIYVYKTKEGYDQAVKNRKNGQDILQGKMDAPIRCVILNGSLVPNLNYTINSDGRLCVSLRALSEAYDSNTDYDEAAHLLAVPETYGECAFIPAKGALYNISQYFNINNTSNTFDFISTKPPEIWTDTFALPMTDEVVMPVSDISRILGWEFSYTDNILNVVTDSLDDTKEENLLLIETQTSSETIELDDLDFDESDTETESEDSDS